MRKPFNILLDDSDRKILEEIQEEKGIEARSQVFKLAIREWHDAIFLDYRRVKKEATRRITYNDPIERMEAEAEKKKMEGEAKRALDLKRAMNICERLGGTVTEESHGALVCGYTTYEKVGKRIVTASRKVYFDNLHENHITDQYRGGTREEIEALLSVNTQQVLKEQENKNDPVI